MTPFWVMQCPGQNLCHSFCSLQPLCPPSLLPKLSSKRQTSVPTHPADGSHLHRRSTRRQVISISRLPTRSRSRNSSKRLVMLSPGRQSAENSARKRTRLPMPGGMHPKPTSEDSQTVSMLFVARAKTVGADNPVVAIQALTQTIVHLTKGGRFRQAADREKEIGQIYLQESNDLRKACESYVRAGEWYSQEDAAA